MNFKNKNGITLVSLVITIIVLLILSSITVYLGINLITKANLESLKTNMLLIQAEAKSVVEEFNFKIYNLDKNTEDYNTQLERIKTETIIGTELTDELKNKMKAILNDAGIIEEVELNNKLNNCYYLTSNDLNNIKIDVKDEDYVIIYDFDNITAEVYYIKGYKYSGRVYYSLTQLNEIKD